MSDTQAVTAAGTRMVLAAGSPGGPMNILLPHNRRKRDSGGPLEVSFSQWAWQGRKQAGGLAWEGAAGGWPGGPVSRIEKTTFYFIKRHFIL